MKTILRLENVDDGMGFFYSYRSYIHNLSRAEQHIINKLKDRHNEEFPAPHADEGIDRFITHDEFCAFKSIESLEQWVTKEELQILISVGIKVLMIDVDECDEGEYQIVYKKTNIINTKDVTDLFLTKKPL